MQSSSVEGLPETAVKAWNRPSVTAVAREEQNHFVCSLSNQKVMTMFYNDTTS